MIDLAQEEKILLTIRRHWFVLVGPTVAFFVALILPSLVLTVAPRFIPTFENPSTQPIINFTLSLYFLAVLLYMLVLWADYYLDVWIITTKRLIDIRQTSLFSRQISEFQIDRVQDVTIDIHGIIPTILKFGNLRVETASASSFTIENAPNLYEAKDLILQYSGQIRPLVDNGKNAPPNETF